VSYSLGVDLGTTYSAAAVCDGGVAQIVSLGHHAFVVPSVIFVGDGGQFLVGEPAERRAGSDPTRVAREFKRRIGDPVPFILGGTPYTTEALSAMLLRRLVEGVIEQQGRPPDRTVVTFPANWGSHKQERLAEVVRLAEIGEVQTITEPEAAAIWYASEERVAAGETIAVYDLGGGTFDAAVLQKTDTGFTVLGTPRGIERLGGVDIDAAIVSYVLRAIGSDGSDLTSEPAITAARRLRVECIAAKEALSSDTSASISVALPGLHADVRLTRAELEEMVRPLLQETVRSLEHTIRSAGLDRTNVDRVLLVGGASRMPIVSELVTDALARPSFVDAHPKHVIALGAAIAAGATTAAPTGTVTPPPPVRSLPDAPPAPAPPPAPVLPRPQPVTEPVVAPPPPAVTEPAAAPVGGPPPQPVPEPAAAPPPVTAPAAAPAGGPPPAPAEPLVTPLGQPAGPDPGPRPRRRAVVAIAVGAVVAAAGVAAVLVLAPSEGSPRTDTTDSTDDAADTVAIPATQQWTDPHVDCSTGDVLDISASGTILPNKDDPALVVDPDGSDVPELHQFNVPELPDANHAALIGSIDQQDSFFVVGKGTSYECPRDGSLFLGINDTGVFNNSGKFDATISPGSHEAGRASPTGRTLEIPITQLWTDTHLDCKTGDVLDISASGTAMHEQSPQGAVDPTGLTDPGYHQYNVPGLPDANTASLIGSIDQQLPFYVGKGTTYECPRDGKLFLGVNDGGVANNSGSWVATIKRQAG
jgi:actin-like ATPase involved in cell morphogenesis